MQGRGFVDVQGWGGLLSEPLKTIAVHELAPSKTAITAYAAVESALHRALTVRQSPNER
jgi:hypothetical protein